ncbi:unnamed protein product [Heligmosomoides polygyrus]|uniref:Uncharacterized protein n=1 Tax=Heligmosomoides polygyrus TaxID=6339 RepID=A0A183FFS9_HELPZ|nr:unnamed protein product [Heligmosomoides polygyrus]
MAFLIPTLEDMQTTQSAMQAEMLVDQLALRAEIKQLHAALQVILVRTAPCSSYAFCTVEENRGTHLTGRCTRYPDTVARTAQASRRRLRLRCLRDEHSDDCGVRCGNCGLDHNSILVFARRPNKQQQNQAKRPRN